MPRQATKFTVFNGQTRSAVWTLMTHKANAYLWPTGLGGDYKISLHGDRWRYGFTQEHLGKPSPLIEPHEDRALFKWTRPAPLDNGLTRCLEIFVPPEAASVPAASDDLEGVTAVAPCPPQWVQFIILIGPGDRYVSFDHGDTRLPSSVAWLPLGDTERISIVVRYNAPLVGDLPKVGGFRGDRDRLESGDQALLFVDTEHGVGCIEATVLLTATAQQPTPDPCE